MKILWSQNYKIKCIERNVDINGMGMYTLGKYRKSINDEQI